MIDVNPILGRIKAARKDAGFSQEEAAPHLYMSRSLLAATEAGYTPLTVDRLLHMATLYQVSPVWLLTGEEMEVASENV